MKLAALGRTVEINVKSQDHHCMSPHRFMFPLVQNLKDKITKTKTKIITSRVSQRLCEKSIITVTSLTILHPDF